MIRYLDMDSVEATIMADTKWQKRARLALKTVTAKTAKDRAAAIDAKHTIWKHLKKTLAKASNNKCWYCESEELRSDMAVDHFRPKNQVAECPSHPGYWWLAFDWENYRFSCNFCNSPHGTAEDPTRGGKHDHFPLFTPPPRALVPEDDWREERPKLLDPVVPGDAVLLIFLDDGNPRPRYDVTENAVAFERANVSIELYHLKHERLTARRAEIYRQIKSYVRMGDTGEKHMSSNWQLGESQRNEAIKGIKWLTRPGAQFSAAATDFLEGFKTQRKWLQGVC
jgi:uncharacterized protein (TIGR02646 family)